LPQRGLVPAAPDAGPEPIAEETLGNHRSHRCSIEPKLHLSPLLRAAHEVWIETRTLFAVASLGGHCPSRSSSSCLDRSRGARWDRNPIRLSSGPRPLGQCLWDRSPAGGVVETEASPTCRSNRSRCGGSDGAEAPSKGNVAVPVGSVDASVLVPNLGASRGQFPSPFLPRFAPPWWSSSRTHKVRPATMRSQLRIVVRFRAIAENFARLARRTTHIAGCCC
jgi:hypothetical protein